MLTCDVVAELGDAFALGALEPDEARQVESHLESCPDCRETLAADQSVVAVLALSAPQVQPPTYLKTGLMAAVRADAERPPRRSWLQRLFPSPTRLAFGAASVASLAFVATLSWALTLQSQINTARVAPAPAPVAAASAAPGGDWGDWDLARADMKRLVGSDTAPEARGWIYVDPSNDSALLVAYKLPPLQSDRSYQIWLVRNGERISGGVFTVDAEGYGWLKVRAPQAIAGYQRVGITVEPRQGSPAPTGSRVLGGDL